MELVVLLEYSEISELKSNIEELEALIYKIVSFKYEREMEVDPENTIINCPITHEVLDQPIINSIGNTYSKNQYLEYMSSNPNSSDP